MDRVVRLLAPQLTVLPNGNVVLLGDVGRSSDKETTRKCLGHSHVLEWLSGNTQSHPGSVVMGHTITPCLGCHEDHQHGRIHILPCVLSLSNVPVWTILSYSRLALVCITSAWLSVASRVTGI